MGYISRRERIVGRAFRHHHPAANPAGS